MRFYQRLETRWRRNRSRPVDALDTLGHEAIRASHRLGADDLFGSDVIAE